MNGNDYDGTLVNVEGIDGAGKTTVVEGIETALEDHDIEVVTTKEPTDLWTGDVVYEALGDEQINSLTDFFLFVGDRTHHVEQRIRPALERGAVVVTDRYSDSTRAYQSHRIAEQMGVSYDEARQYIDDVFDPWSIEPDLTIYIDISVDTAMRRCNTEDKYEKRENLERVYEAYDEMYDPCNPFVRRLDGERSKAHVRHQAVNTVKTQIADKLRDDSGDEEKTYADAIEEDG